MTNDHIAQPVNMVAFTVIRRDDQQVREQLITGDDSLAEADALAEGGYTIAEYRALWLKLNGAWDDSLPVYVLQITSMGGAP